MSYVMRVKRSANKTTQEGKQSVKDEADTTSETSESEAEHQPQPVMEKILSPDEMAQKMIRGTLRKYLQSLHRMG